MTNLKAIKGFHIRGYGNVFENEVFPDTLVTPLFSPTDYGIHGRTGDPRQLWEPTEDDLFRPPPPLPVSPGGATTDVDFSTVTLTQFNGTNYVDVTHLLEFTSPQSQNGLVVLTDGQLTRVGRIGILTFILEFDRDAPTRINLQSLIPEGGRILAIPYAITDNSSHDFADEDQISTSLQNGTELHLDRNNDLGDTMRYWYMVVIGGYDD